MVYDSAWMKGKYRHGLRYGGVYCIANVAFAALQEVTSLAFLYALGIVWRMDVRALMGQDFVL